MGVAAASEEGDSTLGAWVMQLSEVVEQQQAQIDSLEAISTQSIGVDEIQLGDSSLSYWIQQQPLPIQEIHVDVTSSLDLFNGGNPPCTSGGFQKPFVTLDTADVRVVISNPQGIEHPDSFWGGEQFGVVISDGLAFDQLQIRNRCHVGPFDWGSTTETSWRLTFIIIEETCQVIAPWGSASDQELNISSIDLEQGPNGTVFVEKIVRKDHNF